MAQRIPQTQSLWHNQECRCGAQIGEKKNPGASVSKKECITTDNRLFSMI